MTPNESTAVNLGKAVGDGLMLNTVEVVAVLHNACLQVDAGSAAALPRSLDDLWITDAGKVVLPRIPKVEPTRVTVGLLLETLLPPVNASNDTVPAALRTLPARLRESASTSDASELKDLLTILRWHLPYDSTEVLRDFVARAQLATVAPPTVAPPTVAPLNVAPRTLAPPTVAPLAVAPVEHPATQDAPAPVANAPTASAPVVTAPVAIAPVAIESVAAAPVKAGPVRVARIATAPAGGAVRVAPVRIPPVRVAPVRVAAVTTPAAPIVPATIDPLSLAPAEIPAGAAQARPRPSRRGLAIAAAVLLAIGAAGFAGYRYSAIDPAVATEAPVNAEGPVVPLPGRITRSDTPPPAPSATPVAEPTVAPRTESNPRPLELAVNGGAFSPSFDSAGTALVFHAGQKASGRLFHASLDDRGTTSAITPLLEDRGRTYHARLSPDGIWVAFDSDRDGERGVYVASRNGKHVARVSGEGFAAVPSWSPDMKWLAFVRAEPGRPNVWNLWLRDVETGELTRKSAFRSGQVWGASWFPGSRSVAYSHEDLLIVSETGSTAAKTFRSPIAGRLVRTPAVSPDGSRIVFQVYRDGAWLLDIKSGSMSRLLDDPSAEEFAWDPDGRQIAYHSRRDGQWRIWLLKI